MQAAGGLEIRAAEPVTSVAVNLLPSSNLREGIPSFVNEGAFWQIASQRRMHQLLSLVERTGWEEAAKSFTEAEVHYWTNSARAGFTTILPAQTFDAVLDVGCGAGAISLTLTGLSREVWALDLCIESLQLLKARAHHLGIRNLFPVQASATKLPFEDCQFDLVLFNGVLERVGYAGRFHEVLAAQHEALQEANRVLKPGGHLYVGIENRFGANYLLGARDEHTNLRWVNVLPRRLANFYSLLFKRREFTAFTHSYWGLRWLLRRAGFSEPRFWCPVPTYRDIKMLVPLEQSSVNLFETIARLYPQKLSRWHHSVSRFVPGRFWKVLAPHYSLVARKPYG